MASLRDIESRQDAMPPDVFASAAADVVRGYLSARFGLAAPRRTTEEFLGDLTARAAPVSDEGREALGKFLAGCDLAKFAGVSLDSMQRSSLIDTARGFIRAVDLPHPPQS